MTNYRNNFNETITDLDSKVATVGLERIKLIVNEGTKEGITHRFLTTFLLPAPLILSFSIKAVLRSQPKLNVFASSILQKHLPIAIATVLYFVMWLYLLPIFWTFWQLFHQVYSWEDFFVDLFRWQTFQAIILVLIHSFFARVAMNGFKLTQTFYDRYDLLRKVEIAKASGELTAIEAGNKTIANTPELLNSLIHQTINALVASGKFSPENVRTVTEVMKEIGNSFLTGATPIDYNSSIDLKDTKLLEQDNSELFPEEEYGEYGDFDSSEDKGFK